MAEVKTTNKNNSTSFKKTPFRYPCAFSEIVCNEIGVLAAEIEPRQSGLNSKRFREKTSTLQQEFSSIEDVVLDGFDSFESAMWGKEILNNIADTYLMSSEYDGKEPAEIVDFYQFVLRINQVLDTLIQSHLQSDLLRLKERALELRESEANKITAAHFEELKRKGLIEE